MSDICKISLNKEFIRNSSSLTVTMKLLTIEILMIAGTIVGATPLQPAYAQNVSFDPPQQIVGTPGQDAEPPQIAGSGRNVYIIWHEFPTGDVQPDVFFSRSTNRGATFASPPINLSNSAGTFSADEQIAVSGDNVFVVWSENGQIFFKRSTDEGATFTTTAKILSTTGGAVRPQIAVSEDDNVFVAWQANGQAGNPDIFFTESSNAGSCFTPERNISNNNGTSEFRDSGKQIRVSRDHVIVTWRDDTIAGAGFDVFFAHGR